MRTLHRPLRRLSLPLLTALAVLMVAGAGVATGYLTSGGQFGAGPDRPALTPALAGAPWIEQPDGSPTISEVANRQALRFPAGVTYEQALTALYLSALERGELPEGAELVEPLDKGIVVSGTPEQGITLSLVAPFGYDEQTGAVRPPVFRLSGDLSPEQVTARVKQAQETGSALPEGAVVVVPDLPDCQEGGADSVCAVAKGVNR